MVEHYVEMASHDGYKSTVLRTNTDAQVSSRFVGLVVENCLSGGVRHLELSSKLIAYDRPGSGRASASLGEPNHCSVMMPSGNHSLCIVA